MADYWKSHAKKFCDFCKCWIADNKPSIGFHESGKRHKENVAKRLSEISKNSTKSYKEELQVDKEMKKMEEQALKAYMKDLQENPDFTSQRILEQIERKQKELEESVKTPNSKEPVECVKPEAPLTNSSISSDNIWYEAKSDEGYTYYWNASTAESKWEPPDEGYVSLEKQKNKKEFKDAIKRRRKEEKSEQKINIKIDKKAKLKKGQDDKIKECCVSVGPAPKPDPYGAWSVIEPKIEKPLDLQLPEQEYIAIKVPALAEQEIKFKEKTISSLDQCDFVYNTFKKEIEECSNGFKKRKINRGNMRQKFDTE